MTPKDSRPVFVAFNAPFDWMFINDYFLRYLGKIHLGTAPLTSKPIYGQAGVDWEDTSFNILAKRFLEEKQLSHNALKDAQDQAEIFRTILKQADRHSPPK